MNSQDEKANMASNTRISIDKYLEKVATFSGHEFGSLVRRQFQDIQGASELAMLAAPTAAELDQLKRAVAIMTPDEKQNAHRLTDEQIYGIAADARVDPANLAIFINGYALYCKRPS